MTEGNPYQSPPVNSDEMSFAIALFVAAALGKIAPVVTAGRTRQESAAPDSEALLLGATVTLQGEPAWLPDEVPLVCAVSVLWHHYERDERQQAICSRLVAWYALMAQRQAALTGPGDDRAYLQADALSPAIVKAVATATVDADGLFDEAEFEALVESYAVHGEGRALLPHDNKSSRHRVTTLSVTEDVQQLSLQLLAFQSCVATDPAGATAQFRTLEQLCLRVANLSGTATLHAILSRARRAAIPDFPWLQSAAPSDVAWFTGPDSVSQAPTLRDAMKCEMAILGFFIELIRILLGDAVTIQLLRSLWPLASLGSDHRMLPQTSAELIAQRDWPTSRVQ